MAKSRLCFFRGLPIDNLSIPASPLNFANYQDFAFNTGTPNNLFSCPPATPISQTPQQNEDGTADLGVRKVNSISSDEDSHDQPLTEAPISSNNELPLTFAPESIDALIKYFKLYLANAEENNMEVHEIWNTVDPIRERYYWKNNVPNIQLDELIYDFQLLLDAKDTVTAVTYAIWVNNLKFKSWYRGEQINLGSNVQPIFYMASDLQLLSNFKKIALSEIGHLTFTMLEGNQRLINLIVCLDSKEFQLVLDCIKVIKDDFQKRNCLDLIKNLIEMQQNYEMKQLQQDPLNVQRLADNLAALKIIYPARPSFANRMYGLASTPGTITPIQSSTPGTITPIQSSMRRKK